MSGQPVNETPGPGKPQRGKPKSGCAVLLGVLGLALVVLGGLAFGYYKLIHYTRTAAYHVPAGSRFAARLDLEQVVLFAPVRKHVFPVLQRRGASAKQQAIPDRLARFEKATRVNLGRDLREVMLIHGAELADWGLVVGGLFPKGKLAKGIHEVLEEEGIEACRLVSRARLICNPPGLVLEQAADGVLLIASHEGFLDKMLPRSDGYKSLGLEREGPGGFGLLTHELEDISSHALFSRVPMVNELPKLQRLEGRLALGADATITLQLVPRKGEDLAAWQPQLERLRTAFGLLLGLQRGRDFLGERGLLERAEVRPGDNGALVIEARWEESEIDQAARSLAIALERALALGAAL